MFSDFFDSRCLRQARTSIGSTSPGCLPTNRRKDLMICCLSRRRSSRSLVSGRVVASAQRTIAFSIGSTAATNTDRSAAIGVSD